MRLWATQTPAASASQRPAPPVRRSAPPAPRSAHPADSRPGPACACVDVAADAGGEPLGHRHHQRRGGELVAAVVAAESVDALPVLQPRLPGTRANRTVMDRPPSGRALVVRVAW